jgi:hypothetical protein
VLGVPFVAGTGEFHADNHTNREGLDILYSGDGTHGFRPSGLTSIARIDADGDGSRDSAGAAPTGNTPSDELMIAGRHASPRHRFSPDLWTIVRANNTTPKQFNSPSSTEVSDSPADAGVYYDVGSEINLSYGYQYQADAKSPASISSEPVFPTTEGANPYIKPQSTVNGGAAGAGSPRTRRLVRLDSISPERARRLLEQLKAGRGVDANEFAGLANNERVSDAPAQKPVSESGEGGGVLSPEAQAAIRERLSGAERVVTDSASLTVDASDGDRKVIEELIRPLDAEGTGSHVSPTPVIIDPREAPLHQLACRIAALARAGQFGAAGRMADRLAEGRPDYAIGLAMQDVLANCVITHRERVRRLGGLAQLAAEALKSIGQQTKVLVRRLDERLLRLATGDASRKAVAGLSVRGGTVLASILLESDFDVQALKDDGVGIESVSKTTGVAVARIPLPRLVQIALRDGVRRIEAVASK